LKVFLLEEDKRGLWNLSPGFGSFATKYGRWRDLEDENFARAKWMIIL